MDKQTLEQDGLFLKRVEDAVRLAARKPYFLGFLDPRQRALATSRLKALGFRNVLFWGGCDGAERVFAGFFPGGEEPAPEAFPVGALRVSWKAAPARAVTHRDVLGSVLALGVLRRSVGDILVEEDGCLVFLDTGILPFVLQSLEKVGGASVRCREAPPGEAHREQKFEPIEDTIASARLDCVVASLLNLSRTAAALAIEHGRVQLNFEPCEKPTRLVSPGMTLSVRGAGRFDVLTVGPPTRKGRLRFSARKYL